MTFVFHGKLTKTKYWKRRKAYNASANSCDGRAIISCYSRSHHDVKVDYLLHTEFLYLNVTRFYFFKTFVNQYVKRHT